MFTIENSAGLVINVVGFLMGWFIVVGIFAALSSAIRNHEDKNKQ